MGLFDSIWATLPCPVCGSIKEREIQTKTGLCAMFSYQIGDTIEPFFHGDYWMEERWYCDDCRDVEQREHSHKAFIHCLNGLIVEVTPEKPPESKLPDWAFIHQLSSDRRRFRQTLIGIRDIILAFRERANLKETERALFLDISPKTIDELLDEIVDDIERAKKEEPPGLS
jgi:hypothetical protein